MRSKKYLFYCLVAVVLCIGAIAEAVTLDITSPTDGSVFGPGDTVVFAMTVTNDTDDKDVIFIMIQATIEINGRYNSSESAKPFKVKLDAGKSVYNMSSLTIPENLPEPPIGQITITLEATAVGKKSKTQSSDAVTVILDI